MKIFKKAMALFLAMLMILAVSPVSAFAEEAEEIVPDAGTNEETNTETLNPFSLFGQFFENIGKLLRLVIQFLNSLFTGTGGDDALEQLK